MRIRELCAHGKRSGRLVEPVLFLGAIGVFVAGFLGGLSGAHRRGLEAAGSLMGGFLGGLFGVIAIIGCLWFFGAYLELRVLRAKNSLRNLLVTGGIMIIALSVIYAAPKILSGKQWLSALGLGLTKGSKTFAIMAVPVFAIVECIQFREAKRRRISLEKQELPSVKIL